MKKKLLLSPLAILLLAFVFSGCKRNFSEKGPSATARTVGGFLPASALNAIMQQAPGGINLGGVFEGGIYNSYDTSFAAVKHHLDDIAAKSFKYVRLQVNWERADRRVGGTNTILPSFMNQIKNAVDYALQKKLLVVLNMQNHSLLMTNPSAYKSMFLSQWEQIATAFEPYPDSLMFEILNEPRDSMDYRWNEFYQAAYNKIRTTPSPTSNNKYRTILVGVTHSGGPDYLKELDKSVIKNDLNAMITVHYYSPFTFTHQNSWISGSDKWKGTRWDNTAAERNLIDAHFAYAKSLFQDSGYILNIGEYGSYSEADMDSRVRYTNYLMKYFRSQLWGSGYFNYLLNPGFGIYDVTNGYVTDLVNVFQSPNISTPLPPADVPDRDTILYKSDSLSATRNQGWYYYNNDASVGSMTISPNKIQVKVTSIASGSNVNGLLIRKRNAGAGPDTLSFKNGTRYNISFKASSTNPFQRIQAVNEAGGEASFFYPDATLRQYNYVFRATKDDALGTFKIYLGDVPGLHLPYTITISDVQIHKYDFSTRPYPQF